MTETTDEPGGEIARIENAGELVNARIVDGSGVIDVARWQVLAAIAETVAKTEFVPAGLRGRKPAIMAALLYGDELGVGPMAALKGIDVIDGNPTVDAALSTSLIYKAGHKLRREELRDEQGVFLGCVAHGERADGTRDSFTFTLAMAARAGLMSKNNWKNYPEAMCWARAVTQLARILFPDVFMGALYGGEEVEPAEPTRPPDELGGVASLEHQREEVADAEAPEAAAPADAPAPASQVAETAPLPGDEPDGDRPGGPQDAAPVVEGDGEAAAQAEQPGRDDQEPGADESDPAAETGAGDRRADDAEHAGAGGVGADAGQSGTGDGGGASQFQIEQLGPEHTPDKVAARNAKDVMLFVNQAVERGDVEFVQGVTDYENGRKGGPRKMLVDALAEALYAAEQKRAAKAAESGPGDALDDDEPELVDGEVVAEEDDPPLPPFTPGAVEDGPATLAAAEVGSRPALRRVLNGSSWMQAHHPEDNNWTLEALVKSGNRAFYDTGHLERPATELGEFTDQMLEGIYAAMPIQAREAVARDEPRPEPTS